MDDVRVGPVTLTDLRALALTPAMFYYAAREQQAGRDWPVVRGHTWTDAQRDYVLGHLGRVRRRADTLTGVTMGDEAANTTRETPHMTTTAIELTPFDGKDVIAVGINVRNAGDGLSDSLNIEPREFHHGDKVYVVMETECVGIGYDPVKNTSALRRVHTLKAGTATIVDEAEVKAMIEAQAAKNEIERLRIQREKDEAKGNVALTDGDVDLDERPKAGEPAPAPEPGADADGFYDAAADPTAPAPDAAERAGLPDGTKPALKAITGGRAPKKAGAAKKAAPARTPRGKGGK